MACAAIVFSHAVQAVNSPIDSYFINAKSIDRHLSKTTTLHDHIKK